MSTALITGGAGQDGILLARLLLEEGHSVISAVRDPASARGIIAQYAPEAECIRLDVRDRLEIRQVLRTRRPDEIYNLAAFSSVARSWSDPWSVTEVNGLAVLGLLEEVRALNQSEGYSPRICQASSSEMFGLVSAMPQNEDSPHHPRSPYATAKSFAHHTAVNFRESYGLFVATAILFNHESPLRPRTFVTRKVTSGVAAIALGRQDTLTLGRTDIRRDWGAAPDYVEAMRRALAADHPDDYCIATGRSHTLEEFVTSAFEAVGLPDGLDRVVRDPTLLRPADVPETRGDPTRAKRKLGWEPQMPFEGVVGWMVRADLRRLQSGVEDDPDYLRV